MRKSVIISIAAAAICLLGLGACTKDFTGRTIRFRASTRPYAPATRTSYSGATYNSGSSVYERIDWSDGDVVVLAMKNNDVAMATQQYKVNTISVAGVNSKTGLEPYGSDNGLTWGQGTHDFWSGYPASNVTVGDHSLQATIPSSQVVTYSRKANNISIFNPDMSNAFMVAGLQDVPADSGINLDYYPGFTCFDFTVGANDNTTITSFEMETGTYEIETASIMPIAGIAKANFDATDNMSFSFQTIGTTSNSIGLVFHDDKDASYNPIISTSTSMNFKVFALPKDITGVRIKFNLSDGTNKSLRLKQVNTTTQDKEWITFPAAAKINITGLLVPGAVWYINFDYPRQEQWIVHPDIEIGVE